MSAVLPNGYLAILEAADLLSRAMYAGVRDLPVVSRLRKMPALRAQGQASTAGTPFDLEQRVR
jgi:hypothetical protein